MNDSKLQTKLIALYGERPGLEIFSFHHFLSLWFILDQDSVASFNQDLDVKHCFVSQFLGDKENYPVNLKFGRPKITTNEKIVLASMFYPLYAFAVQLSPEPV
jgi:hypothetical protein